MQKGCNNVNVNLHCMKAKAPMSRKTLCIGLNMNQWNFHNVLTSFRLIPQRARKTSRITFGIRQLLQSRKNNNGAINKQTKPCSHLRLGATICCGPSFICVTVNSFDQFSLQVVYSWPYQTHRCDKDNFPLWKRTHCQCCRIELCTKA